MLVSLSLSWPTVIVRIGNDANSIVPSDAADANDSNKSRIASVNLDCSS